MHFARDYDLKARDVKGQEYAGGLDCDAVHPFMLKSFQPFFLLGRMLELGCLQGTLEHDAAAMSLRGIK